MKTIILIPTLLLFQLVLFAQSETEARDYLQKKIESLKSLYKEPINNLRLRIDNGETTAETALDSTFDALSAAYQLLYKDIIYRFPNTETATENMHMFYFNEPFDTLLAHYQKLGPVALQSKNGQDAAAFIERGKKLQPGVEAPTFSHPDTSGKPVSLQDYRGKYVLLEFWASWCEPCRAENPNIKAAYSNYNPSGFDVLGISMDKERDKGKWLKTIYEDGLPWQQVSDLKGYGNEVFWLYNVLPIPDNYLIGPDGKIIARGLRGKKLNDKLEEIFEK